MRESEEEKEEEEGEEKEAEEKSMERRLVAGGGLHGIAGN